MTLAERLRANATLLRMMVDGETPLQRRMLRSLVADLNAHAREAERLEAQRTAAVEVIYQAERAA